MFRLAALAVITALMSMTPAAAQTSGEWQRYVDPTFGFSAALPLDAFEVVAEDDTPGMALKEVGGQATINLYGGPAQGMTREALERRLETGTQRTTTTYKAGGESWFVLSGYYGREREDTIFYTKSCSRPITRPSRPSRLPSRPGINRDLSLWWSILRTISPDRAPSQDHPDGAASGRLGLSLP